MILNAKAIVSAALLLSFLPVAVQAIRPADSREPPVIPVGYDAYRMWDKWACLRIGQRTYMRSTYDRRGENEYGDASHFLYQLADDRNVTLDVTGPGILVFARYNHWHGSPWHYVIDGNDNVVKETSTADPNKPVENSVFIPEAQFPNPLTWTWSHTKGADLMWVPLPFEKSFLMAYERTHYGTGYYIFHKFAPGTKNLSQPIKSWTPQDLPPKDVLDLLRSVSDGTFPQPRDSRTEPQTITNTFGSRTLAPKETYVLAEFTQAPASIRRLALSIDQAQAPILAKARLRIRWDHSPHASVDAPVGLLFGAGSLFNRDNKEYLVKAFPVTIRFHEGKVDFNMHFPMPFQRNARLELIETAGTELKELNWQVWTQPYSDPPNHVGYFHATYVDHGVPELGKDLVFLDTTKVEGGGEWCGHFVGTSFIFSDQAGLGTLEGDPRFYFDDSQTPQAQGTGTEEWGGGGDYWGGRTMTLPFAGHPVGCKSAKEAKSEGDKINSAYRFLLADLMPFGRNARITFEHGPENDSAEHYQSVTYWYGRHSPCLKLTDEFHVGDAADEARHKYESPTASDVQQLSSRYEWGPDHLKGKEIFPESSDTGRYMTGTTTFTLSLDPANIVAMLRRKLDYSFPHQCAKVWIADDAPGALWREVGLWYLAGSNTCIYSNPEPELGAVEHNIRVSNRRWRDDEFLLPRELTESRASIRVKLEFVPKSIPLFPGHPLPPQAWSEYRYWAYCYVMPN